MGFAQTVKAAEPVFTCVMSYLVLGTVFKWQVYASLFPIIAGVCVASLKELSFSYKSLICALISNVAFASRAVLSKLTMNEPVGKNMDAANLYGVLTMMAFALTVKRVAIIVATCLVFRNPMSRIGVIGSSIAIAGTFGYSYAKQKWP